VIVRTGDVGDPHGMTAFAIEKGTPGFSAGKKADKLGMRASETTELIFEDCRVSKKNVIGEVGEGFIQSLKVLDGGRISIGALSFGIARGALDASIQYSKERHQFGKPISQFQGISFKLAEMATKIEAAELLVRQAADLKDKNGYGEILCFGSCGRGLHGGSHSMWIPNIPGSYNHHSNIS